MQTFDQSLIELVRKGMITKENAMEQATSPSEIDLGLKGISSSKASAQSLISQMENSQQKERLSGWLKRAQELYEKRREDEARAELRRILAEQPDHKEANALMARIREMDDKSEKKKDVSGIIKNALQMYREGKQQASILEFQKALEIDPTNKQAEGYVRSIRAEMENQTKARETYQMAVQAQQSGDLNGALDQVAQALVLDPTHEQAKVLQRNLKLAIQKETAKEKAAEYSQSAVELYKNGDLLGALVAWNKAYDLNPDLEEVARYLQQGIQKLLSFGIEGIEMNPEKENISGLFEQGVRSYVRGDFQTALEFFKKAVGKADGNSYLTAYLQKSNQMLEEQINQIFQEGWRAHQAGEWLTAQKEYSKVLRLSPGHPEVVRQLSELKTRIQQESERLYAEGKKFFDANDTDNAIQVWEKILEMDPSNEKAVKRIEEVKLKKNTLSGIFSKIG
jgi:tetratricopeptide (TPR) repeat protein